MLTDKNVQEEINNIFFDCNIALKNEIFNCTKKMADELNEKPYEVSQYEKGMELSEKYLETSGQLEFDMSNDMSDDEP